MSEQELCFICSYLDVKKLLTRPVNVFTGNGGTLGPWSSLRASARKCPLCRLVAHTLESSGQKPAPYDIIKLTNNERRYEKVNLVEEGLS